MQAESLLCQRLSVMPNFIGGTLRFNVNYKGPILQVYDGTNLQDVWSIKDVASFGGSNNVTVAKVYDQSGNGRDFAQATTTKRPKIYDSSTGLLRTNPKGPVVLRFDGVDDSLGRTDGCGLTGSSAFTIWQMLKINTAGGPQTIYSCCHFGTSSGNQNCALLYSQQINGGSTDAVRFLAQGIADVYFTPTNTIAVNFHDDIVDCPAAAPPLSGVGWRINGSGVVTNPNGGSGANGNWSNAGASIGLRDPVTMTLPLCGDWSALAMWTSQLSANDRGNLIQFSKAWRTQ